MKIDGRQYYEQDMKQIKTETSYYNIIDFIQL